MWFLPSYFCPAMPSRKMRFFNIMNLIAQSMLNPISALFVETANLYGSVGYIVG